MTTSPFPKLSPTPASVKNFIQNERLLITTKIQCALNNKCARTRQAQSNFNLRKQYIQLVLRRNNSPNHQDKACFVHISKLSINTFLGGAWPSWSKLSEKLESQSTNQFLSSSARMLNIFEHTNQELSSPISQAQVMCHGHQQW